jgi:subtilisin family serine protease
MTPLIRILTAAITVAMGVTAAEIAPELRRQAARGERLEVLVVLREQPQAGIVERVEGRSRLRLELAEENYRRAASLPLAGGSIAALLRKELDDLIVEVRQEAFREIEARLRPSQEAVARLIADAGGGPVRRYSIANVVAATIPAAALSVLESDPAIAEILPIEALTAQLSTSVSALGAPAFWSRGWTGDGEAVAVIDSGIRGSHPAFSGVNVVPRTFGTFGEARTCFDDTVDSAEDRQGHGSHVAGIVASRGSADQPSLVGVARGLGRLIILKAAFRQRQISGVCGGGAAAVNADVLEAIEWARANTPVKIFNFSYGGPPQSDDSGFARLLDGIADAFDVLFVVSAGNDGPSARTVGDPSLGYNTISVANMAHFGTVDRGDDQVARSSSRGPTLGGRYKPDIAAPGSGIRSASHESDGWVEFSGTSMAAPQIAGAAALLRQSGIVNATAIKAVLINTADGAGWSQDWGWGSANLSRALLAGSYVTGSVGPAGSSDGYRLFRGSPTGSLKATLVWRRHASPSSSIASTQFHNLDLRLYNRANGQLIAQSEETVQNVEQLSSRIAADVVLKVDSRSASFGGGISSEPFVLAFSEGAFAAAAGPVLAARCTAPSIVAPGSAFAVSCELSNSGDLDGYNVGVTVGTASGFRGDSRILGNVAAQGKLSVTLTVTATQSLGRFPVTLTFAGEAFGQPLRAAAEVTVATTSNLPAIAASAASLSFTHAGGGSVQPASIRLTNAGAAIPFNVSAASGGNWLSVSPPSGSTPADIQVSLASQRLAPGNYTGSVTVTATGAANSPLVIPVSLTVTAVSTARLRQSMTTRNPLADSPCEVPVAASSFLPTDREAWAWFLVDGVKAGDRASLEWRSPDGAVYATSAWNPAATDGSFCFSGGIYIAGRAAAQMPGGWKVRILWNGSELTVLAFQISLPVTLRESLMTAEIPTQPGCPVPPAVSEYEASAKRAVVWFLLDGARPGDRARVEWYSPDEKLFETAEWDPLSEGGERCFWAWMAIAGTRAATLPGAWKAKVFYNDGLLLTLPFRINPGTRIESIRMTRYSGELAGCREPDEVKEFHRRDSRAYLWYLIRNAKAGDRASVAFHGPGGELHRTSAVDPLPSGGNWCFRFSLPIAGSDAASMFGDWEAHAQLNDETLASARFRVLPVEIADRMTAKSLPEDYRCGVVAPKPAESFLPSDPQVHLYMFLKGAQAEEVVRSEWVSPSGEVVRRTSWAPISSAGNWCFRSAVDLAGTAMAEQLGDWTIRVFLNDFRLFTQPFKVEDAAPETATARSRTMLIVPREAGRSPEAAGNPDPSEPGPPL